MQYKALTIAREFGSGGAEVAARIASELGWQLVDKELINQISRKAHVSIREGNIMDERVDPWLHRITRALWGKSADGFSAPAPVDIFDAESAAALAKSVIEESFAIGHCLIVGRGAQCVLRGKDDVFHAFVHAPWADRVHRTRERESDCTDLAARIHLVDQERKQYVHLHYGEDQTDPHLYDVMVNSRHGVEAAARLILQAMETLQ